MNKFVKDKPKSLSDNCGQMFTKLDAQLYDR